MIVLENVSKEFRVGEETVHAVRDVSLRLHPSRITAIVGPSGGGKSTLLNVIGRLTEPTSGTVSIQGELITSRSERWAARFRNETFGYVVQDFALIETDTVFENVRIPLVYSARRPRGQRRLVTEALMRFGVGDLVDYPVKNLSGGQRQRVALARAIVNSPKVILADEPTGALDQANGVRVFEHLREIADAGHLVVIVTHDLELAEQCDAIHELRDGRLIASAGDGITVSGKE
ncbi:ABC transporter ATP-binding protein [Luethyella okanaganae]|uniref:ABC transporter ATP-binding protein n=1 Tax=Luethyella okanaganae TaxID=69372 RepID=A0ABW1V9K7_9MICO